MRMKAKNPYRMSYMCLAILCCISLSVLFFSINYGGIVRTERHYYGKKVELLANDFEAQLQVFDEIALQISIDSKYQPYYFRGNIYNEMVLLEDFEQYSHYSALTDDYFLYYGDKKIYLSSGRTTELEIYLKKLSGEAKEQVVDALSEEGLDMRMISVHDNTYVMIPLRVYEKTKASSAVCCFVIDHERLQERFQFVSGGMKGNISLYRNQELLYCNQERACVASQKNVLSAVTSNAMYTICYLPQDEDPVVRGFFMTQIPLVLVDVVVIFMIANLFARKSYGTILDITKSYRGKVSMPEDVQHENALEEIDYMMERLLQKNAMANEQINKKQEQLRRQVLQMLLEGNYSDDIKAYLDKLQIRFTGRYFFVISIFFDMEEGVTKDFLSALQKELEEVSLNEEEEAVYVVCHPERMQISAICNVADQAQKEELIDLVCEMAESHGYEPAFGIGGLYPSLSSLSGSWLESIDNIHKNVVKQKEGALQKEAPYDSDELYRICQALVKGDEESAAASLERYIEQLKDWQISILMQRYVFSSFLSEISKAARDCQIELSNQSISLVISAKSVGNFAEAARNMIREFCESRQNLKDRIENDESLKIYEYVNAHFAEYDLSIEKTASDLKTTVGAVRRAVTEHTGRKYKDYIIYLRIEYAKDLLVREDLTVAEICQRVGYGNLAHFFKLFKEMTGMTPAKYRNGVKGLLAENEKRKE